MEKQQYATLETLSLAFHDRGFTKAQKKLSYSIFVCRVQIRISLSLFFPRESLVWNNEQFPTYLLTQICHGDIY
jgi:hypothetical protein